MIFAVAGSAGCSLRGLDGLEWHSLDAAASGSEGDLADGAAGNEVNGEAGAGAVADGGGSPAESSDAGLGDGGGGPAESSDAGDGGAGCPCSEPGQHCDPTLRRCVPNSACADFSATGQLGQPCSALPSSAFPDGAGNDLTCDCSREAAANNYCIWSSETAAGVCYDFTLEWPRWPVPQSSTVDPRFLPSPDGATVADQVTGLVWQRVAPSSASSKFLFHWPDAKDHCRDLALGGFTSGWRLPTRAELLSIIDFTTMDPALDAAAFPGAESADFWSATPSTEAGFAWGVSFFDGQSSDIYDAEVGSARVRCVR